MEDVARAAAAAAVSQAKSSGQNYVGAASLCVTAGRITDNTTANDTKPNPSGGYNSLTPTHQLDVVFSQGLCL